MTRTPNSPPSIVPLRLETPGELACAVDASVTWQKVESASGFGERTRRWFESKGLGAVYVGSAAADFSGCAGVHAASAELVLSGADDNRIAL